MASEAGTGSGSNGGKGTQDEQVLLGGIEHLNVKTPQGRGGSEQGGDYFSLPTVGVSSASGAGAGSSFSTAIGSQGVADITGAESAAAGGLGGGARQDERLLSALKPVYRNEAWRSLEAGTRRNSAAPWYPHNPAAAARAAARNWRQQEEDILMGGALSSAEARRNDSFGTGSGSRGGSPLGTVEEEPYEMDTDDGESGLGSISEEEPWHTAYQFLTAEEQTQLLSFVLDCLEETDAVAASLTRPTSFRTSSSAAEYHSPNAVSPTSADLSSHDFAPSQRAGWNPSDATSSSNSASQPAPVHSRRGSYTPSHPLYSQPHPYSPPPPAAPSVVRIDDFVFSCTVVPVPPGTHPPTGFVVLTGPPAVPASPATAWLPTRLPLRSHHSRASGTSSTSSSTLAPSTRAISSDTPAAPTDAAASALSAYRSPTASASATLPALPRLGPGSTALAGVRPDEPEDPYLNALGDCEMARRIRSHAWEKTALGPISSWPRELKTMVASILASPFRECILYGPSMTIVYNDLYIETAGAKHPDLLGMPAREGWAEIWDGLNAVALRALKGETCYFRDHYLAMERHGFTEETYHTFCYAPFYNDQGEVLGIRNLSVETTSSVVAARRLSTVRDLVQMTSLARTVEDFAESALKSLSSNPYDCPFAILYTVEEVASKPTKKEVRAGFRSNRTTIKLSCRGSLGVPQDHPFLVEEALIDITPPMSRQSSSSASTGTGSTATAVDLRERLEQGALSPAIAAGSPAPSTSSSASTAQLHSKTSEWSWPFEEACLKRDPVLVEDLGAFAETLDRSNGWNTPTRQAVVIPVMVEAGQTVPSAVLVLGVNAMNRYNHLMETFFNLLARHVAIGIFAVLAAEQDRLRADELSISHELRTPLTLILGPLEDMLSGSEGNHLSKVQRDKLVLVNRHANRLLTMVNKLLDFSSIEGGRAKYTYRPVSIGSLTRDIAVLFRDAIERTGIQYVIECEEDPSDALPVYVALDVWEKIIYNLCGNAFKYTVSGRISVTLKSTRGEAVLAVSDTGIGIPQAELGKIFDRFHRIEANSRMATGSGIGLALTLELVKLLGGQLEVESEVGKGSTFTVRLQRGHTHLPMDQVDHTPEEVVPFPNYQNRNLAVVDEAASWRYDASLEEAMESTPLSSASSVTSAAAVSEQGTSSGSGSGEDYLGGADVLSLKNRTIVLVDDSRDLRGYMASLLSKQFTVVPFGDPREALQYINEHLPSLVLTDAQMPYITGQELTVAIRRNPHTALIPVVMVSAQSGPEARAEALEGGCDEYICKPFTARELMARVRIHLQLGLMRVELEKRVEERTRALIESEGRNRALAERYSMLSTVSPVGVIEINSSGQLTYANPRWFEISGASPLRPLEDWKETVVPEDWPKVERLWEMATKGGDKGGEAEERQFRFVNGRWAQLEIRASIGGGLPDGYVGALTDITRQREVELLHIREVEQRAADAEQNRINTENFLDMSSHELRNPLSGVWQNAEVVAGSLDKYVELLDDLQEGHVPPPHELEALAEEMRENVEAVDSILLCASHQGRIADDILNVSKLNMGLLTIQRTPFKLVPRMNEVLRVFEVECSQKSIALKLNADPSIKHLRADWVKADPARLHQILLNFLTNSIKYTSDAPTRRIVVHIQAFENQPPLRPHAMRVSQPPPVQLEDSVWINIAVEDSGRGLSDDELHRLFARFSQANPRSDQYGGSGLGLYISKRLIELHSGFIEVESRLGTGSIFSFSIPAERASPPDSPVARPAVPSLSMAPTARPKRPTSSAGPDPSKPATAKRPLTSPDMESTKASKSSRMSISPPPSENTGPQRILVVEDNLINQKVLLRQLKNAGYEVQVANNGKEALDALAADNATQSAEQFAACLCDIEMPVMGGLEAIKEQRRREQAGEISRRYPICALTGNARDQQIATCLEAGFDDVATKPYKLEDILAKLRTLSGRPSPLAK
ncbi:hypothetical protein JCM10213v2_007179 [Rhodosporidiobolus nylandii]